MSFRTEAAAVEGQQTHGGEVFPHALVNASPGAGEAAAIGWTAGRRDDLLGLCRRHGAVLFRGFPLGGAEAFDRFVGALGLPLFPYDESLSNAVRINRTGRVFTANEAPPEVEIYFHHEMAQTPVFPERILLFCEAAPTTGGETPLCRSDVLHARLSERCPAFVEKCERSGLRYTNVMPDADDPGSGLGRSWRRTLGAETRAAAEARLGALGYRWEWQADGCLRATTPTLPAVLELPPGRKAFFNQLIAAHRGWKDARNDPSKAVRHGDGSALDPGAVAEAVALADELAFDLRWQAGDVALIDNTAVMHGRRPFGGRRSVLASLACRRRAAPLA